MERSEDYGNIAAALAQMRPTPRTEFSQELDEWAAAGFPRKEESGRHPLSSALTRLRGLTPRRLALATAGTTLVAMAVTTVVIASNDSANGPAAPDDAPREHSSVQFSESIPAPRAGKAEGSVAVEGTGRSIRPFSRKAPQSTELNGALTAEGESSVPLYRAQPLLSSARRRDIERSAEIDLLADPADVTSDSTKVFSAVHGAHGIVLHSTTTSGKHASADFDLLIPSARLGDALAAFSAIDEVRRRHEATADITAPTVSVSEELHDLQAKVGSLLSQLSSSKSAFEREAIEAELNPERRRAARLRARLARLHRRTTFSSVSVRIESGASEDSGGTWGIGDAFDDAGHVLGIAAGVTLVGLAVIAPLVLLCLLAWLAQRLWLRSRRERALDT